MLELTTDQARGEINSVKLYGQELLKAGGKSEIYVNHLPLELRCTGEGNTEVKMRSERYVDHFTGWGLEITRQMGFRDNAKFRCFGINYWIKRKDCANTYPLSGPGDCAIEAPLYIDTITALNLNWDFWGEDTRMIFSSTHSIGPTEEFGHSGYEHETPEKCKKYLNNFWRRIYPGVMAFHGGVFYNAKTGEWIAVTCRKPHVGYVLNIEDAGRGVSYDFTLHDMFKPGDVLRLPEIKIYFGKTSEEMYAWMADYLTHYYQQAPDWVFKTAWREGLAWTNEPDWTKQADKYIEEYEKGLYGGIKYSLVTNRPAESGTLPFGYEPDPNHGTKEEFKQMCLRLKEKDIPFLIWMSHSGLAPGAQDIDDDWFMRGVDGGMTISWGSDPVGMYVVNPGHPGYIEYTKKWIKFYMQECGAKGIFMDCLGWSFPSDFKKRDFMRYPGDTNLMAVKFTDEIYAYIKELDPEGILLGEGASIDENVNIFSVHTNEVRSIDNKGPRDFLLGMNAISKKKFVIDQASDYAPSTGICQVLIKDEYEEHNKFITKFMREHGGPDSFQFMIGDLSICQDMLFVPLTEDKKKFDIDLPDVKTLEEVITKEKYTGENGKFSDIPFGFYKMVKNND